MSTGSTSLPARHKPPMRCSCTPACSALPEGFTSLSALTSLCLDRNYLTRLPASLSLLSHLSMLRWAVRHPRGCLCCAGMRLRVRRLRWSRS
jgi:hypothetical protein